MDFGWSDEEQKFRMEVRGFLDKELPADWGRHDTDAGDDAGADTDEKHRVIKHMVRKLGEQRWLTASWPVEYGGLGWSPMRQFIFNEEMGRRKVDLSRMAMGGGVLNVGPSIITHGTPEQKAKFLPPIARGEVIYGQLFSEPNAGSDLAGIETVAEDKGDYFVVNGWKTWSSMAHKADLAAMLARTDTKAPKHKGISYMIIELKQPGITFYPLVNMCDNANFNTVHLENAIVPKENLIGEQNKGWYAATTTLNLERSFIRHVNNGRTYYGELLDLAKKGIGGHTPAAKQAHIRARLAQLEIETRVSRLLSYRVPWMQERGRKPTHETSVVKLFTSEMTQRMVQTGMEIHGLHGQLVEGSKNAVLNGKAQLLYRAQRAITIGGGTSEIQRNIIAQRGLGMPRG